MVACDHTWEVPQSSNSMAAAMLQPFLMIPFRFRRYMFITFLCLRSSTPHNLQGYPKEFLKK